MTNIHGQFKNKLCRHCHVGSSVATFVIHNIYIHTHDAVRHRPYRMVGLQSLRLVCPSVNIKFKKTTKTIARIQWCRIAPDLAEWGIGRRVLCSTIAIGSFAMCVLKSYTPLSLTAAIRYQPDRSPTAMVYVLELDDWRVETRWFIWKQAG